MFGKVRLVIIVMIRDTFEQKKITMCSYPNPINFSRMDSTPEESLTQDQLNAYLRTSSPSSMRAVWPVCIFFLLGFACTSKSDPGKDYSVLQKELDANKNLWVSKAITHYRFDCILGSFSVQAGIWFTVEVNQDQVVSIIVKETQEPRNPSDFLWITTFEGNFASVQGAINAKANSILATYNKEQGFVEHFYVDWSAGIADDETSIEVANLEIL